VRRDAVMDRRGGRRAWRARALAVLAGVCAVSAVAALTATGGAPVVRVCADPNNLPFSNDRGEGFENRLAQLVAAHLGAAPEYTWWPQRRGFIRNTLDAGLCDLVMGVPTEYELALTTRPYYRSTYVFVSQQSRHLTVSSLDDPRLARLRLGVQLIGDDFANSPPAHALGARGLTRNIVGFSVLGDYSRPNPPARIVEAVADGDVDGALVWGPLAGYFARRSQVALELTPLQPSTDPQLPFAFDISMGVRRGDTARQRMLNEVITIRRAEIDRILHEFGVPRAERPEPRRPS
jgi:mxaJ protein